MSDFERLALLWIILGASGCAYKYSRWGLAPTLRVAGLAPEDVDASVVFGIVIGSLVDVMCGPLHWIGIALAEWHDFRQPRRTRGPVNGPYLSRAAAEERIASLLSTAPPGYRFEVHRQGSEWWVHAIRPDWMRGAP